VILVTYLFDYCCVDGHKEYPIKENLEKWMTAIHWDLLAHYEGVAQDVQTKGRGVVAVGQWSPQKDVTKNNPQTGRKRWDAIRLFMMNSLKDGAV
jgi:hypothetical protein